MSYTVRKGKLHFEPRAGNGPCSRRHVGEANRRIISTVTRAGVEIRYHATKGYRVTRVDGVS